MPRDYARTLGPDVDVVELFAERVADYRATVHRVAAGDLAAAVADGARATRRTPGRRPGRRSRRVARRGRRLERLADDPPLTHADLDAADGVVTGCAVGIAETGTIVLDARRRARAAGR